MIKEILDNLSPEERRRLIHAFDNEFSQHVELENNHFIGVNIQGTNFEITEQIGCWSYGQKRIFT